MIRPNALSQELLRDVASRRYKSKPLFGVMGEILKRDRRLTRNFKISDGERSWKLIEIRSDFHADQGSLDRFRQGVNLLSSVVDTGRVPLIIGANETALLVEWVDGKTLLECPLQINEIDELASSLVETYLRMAELPNQFDQNHLQQMLDEFASNQLISGSTHEAASKLLPAINFPNFVLTGAAFDDVSLPNFLRDNGGKIFYIDVFGVVEPQTMIMNLEKMGSKLDSDLSEALFQRIDDLVGGVIEFRKWSTLARILQTIKGKSRKGNMTNQKFRHNLALQAVTELKKIVA